MKIPHIRCGVSIVQRYFTVNAGPSSEPRFSQSAAFQGRKRPGIANACEIDYYSTDKFTYQKVFSALGSLAMLVLYFGWLREPSDLDEIWNTPPHILTANLERKLLRDQIRDAKAKGKDTELLEAQLEYVDVKEAALRVQFEKKNETVKV